MLDDAPRTPGRLCVGGGRPPVSARREGHSGKNITSPIGRRQLVRMPQHRPHRASPRMRHTSNANPYRAGILPPTTRRSQLAVAGSGSRACMPWKGCSTCLEASGRRARPPPVLIAIHRSTSGSVKAARAADAPVRLPKAARNFPRLAVQATTSDRCPCRRPAVILLCRTRLAGNLAPRCATTFPPPSRLVCIEP